MGEQGPADSRARDVIAEWLQNDALSALRAGPGDTSWASGATSMLKALSDAGYTVAKMEQVGWNAGRRFLHQTLPVSRERFVKLTEIGWEPVYRIVGERDSGAET